MATQAMRLGRSREKNGAGRMQVVRNRPQGQPVRDVSNPDDERGYLDVEVDRSGTVVTKIVQDGTKP